MDHTKNLGELICSVPTPLVSPVVLYSCYKPSDKSCMQKGPDCEYDKRSISE